MDPAAYAYLLGLYLGDGHLVTSGKAPVLRIACTATYPGLIDSCEQAMLAVLAAKVQRIQQARLCLGGEQRRALALPAAPARAGQEAPAADRPRRLAARDRRRPTPATSCAGCSTPTAAGWPTG